MINPNQHCTERQKGVVSNSKGSPIKIVLNFHHHLGNVLLPWMVQDSKGWKLTQNSTLYLVFIEHHFLIPEIHLYGWQPCHPIKGTSHAPNGVKHTTSMYTHNGVKHTTSMYTKNGEKHTHPRAPKMVRNTPRPCTPKMVWNTPIHIHPKWCETHHNVHVPPKWCETHPPMYTQNSVKHLLFILKSP